MTSTEITILCIGLYLLGVATWCVICGWQNEEEVVILGMFWPLLVVASPVVLMVWGAWRLGEWLAEKRR
jgi:hypothetical protein